MKIKSMLLLVMVLILGTFVLSSCDAVGGVMDGVGGVVDGVVDKLGDVPVIGDIIGKDTTTEATVTTTAPVTTTEPAATTTAPVTTTEPVEPADPFENVALADGNYTYDGEAKALAVVGAPEGAVITYAYAKDGAAVDAAVNAGVYAVTATIEYNGDSITKTATLTIAKKAVAVGATFADGSATYTGEAMTYESATGFDADLFTVAYTYSADMIGAGEYIVTATFTLKDADNYEIDGDATVPAKFVINKAPIDLSAVAFPAAGTNYFKGTAYTYEVENLPAGVVATYTYVLNGAAVDELLNVGKYTVTAAFSAANYEIAADSAISAEFEILNTLADMSEIVLNELTLVYNGAKQDYVIEGLPAGIKAELSYTQDGLAANACNVGTYDVVIKFTSEGYTIPDDWKMKTAVLKIAPKKVDLTGVTFEGGAFDYDGTLKTYDPATGYDSNVFNVTYDVVGDQTNAGSFTVTATFSLIDAVNYELSGTNQLTATYTIAKAKVAIGTLADGSDVYDGTAKKHEAAEGYDADIFAVSYSYSGDMIAAGKYTVTATFKLIDEANYEIVGNASVDAEFVIAKKAVAVGATFANGSATYTGEAMTYEAATGYDASIFTVEYSYSGNMTDAGDYTVTATFKLIDENNYEIDGDATMTATFVINKADIDLSGVAFADSLGNVYTGALQTYEAATGYGALTVVYTYSADMINAGEYTVTATFSNGDNYNDATLTATYTIVAKEVSIEGIELVWNVAGADKFGKYYAFQLVEDASYAMVLVDESALAANGIIVTYTTIQLAETTFENDTVVNGAVTECGTYKTVANFAAVDGNYKLVGETSIETIWGVYIERWTPVVK